MSIRTRFLLLIGILSLLATLGIAYASYQFSVNSAVEEAKAKGQIVFDYIESSRQYYKQHQRKLIMELIPKNEFIPELQSGFTLTRGVAETFLKKNPDYVFKQASLDPLHLPNKADKDDLEIINTFKKQPNKKYDDGRITKNGKSYYFFAKPIKVEEEKCLRCHGDPVNAPEEQKRIYGTEHGYNWKLGDIASAYIVYVPLQKAFDLAKKESFNLVFIGAVIVAVMMAVLWFFFNLYIISPISMLEKRATEISLGKNLSETIATSTNDEIGSLARSIDRLRISVEKMLQRFKK